MKKWVLAGIGIWLGGAIILGIAFGSEGKNDSFKPQDEFKLHDWIPIHIGSLNLSINRAVLYLFIVCALTCWAMVYIAKRMQERPNRVQTAVEAVYDFTRRDIVGTNMDERTATKWFATVATLFFFIWFSNLLGYLPLPTSHEKINIFGVEVPAFGIYAATANISVPLVLTLFVWFSYHWEGIRAHGFLNYLRGWIPAGVEGAARIPIFIIEVISHFVRLISLSVRLFANMLAGHLLLVTFALLTDAMIHAETKKLLLIPLSILPFGMLIFLTAFEVLVQFLQAYIFTILAAVYIGGALHPEH
jgi:F-type H+-transporting ATPase subunit a